MHKEKELENEHKQSKKFVIAMPAIFNLHKRTSGITSSIGAVMAEHIQEIYPFFVCFCFSLSLTERVSMRKTREICQSESTLSRKIPENSEPMDKSTKELLESYFSPYFDKLDKLLQDYS